MKVTFKDGTTKGCSNPTEQKQFRNGQASGWVCAFAILGNMPSSEVDALLSADNISHMTFADDEGTTLFAIDGYETITGVVVRHSVESGTVEVQMTKGV